MNTYEPSAVFDTPVDRHSCPFTSEEAQNLAGMVANRRALFEKNKLNVKIAQKHIATPTNIVDSFFNHSSRKTNIIQAISIAQAPNRYSTNQIDYDKENRQSQYEGQDFLKKNPFNKTDYKKPLWSMSEETSKEYDIPLSVKQAKLCFEKKLETPQKNESNLNTPKKGYRIEPAVITQNDSSKIKPDLRNFLLASNESPDIVNPLSSSSTTSSFSSSKSIDSTARLYQNNHYNQPVSTQTKQEFINQNICNRDETIMSVEVKSQLKFKTNNIASRIKKLESKFSCSNEEQAANQTGSIRSSTTTSNESFKSNMSSNVFTHQSPKFLHLFQKQMDLNNSNKNSRSLRSEEAEVTINTNNELPQNLILKTSSLRKMTSSSSIGSSSSSASSTNENESTEITNTGVKVDNAPCVLPSILRNSHQNNLTSQVNQKTFNKLDNTAMCHVTVKPTTRSSYVQPGGFVKNNAAFFNRNSDPLGTKIGFNKVKTSAGTAREALVRWCRNRTVDYDNVSIQNFSSSWSNGLAFCALLHHFMPDAFDYESLSASNPKYNFELAFKTAEDKAGIVSLLDVNDMIEMGDSPDWKCVFTYVHSIYQRFKEFS